MFKFCVFRYGRYTKTLPPFGWSQSPLANLVLFWFGLVQSHRRKNVSRNGYPPDCYANMGKNYILFKGREPQKPFPIPRHIPIQPKYWSNPPPWQAVHKLEMYLHYIYTLFMFWWENQTLSILTSTSDFVAHSFDEWINITERPVAFHRK